MTSALPLSFSNAIIHYIFYLVNVKNPYFRENRSSRSYIISVLMIKNDTD